MSTRKKAAARAAVLRDFGARVRAFRRERDWTQETLGELVGLTRASVANVEAGVQNVGLDRLMRFCEAMEVTPSDLLGGAVPKVRPVWLTATAKSIAREVLRLARRELRK